MSRSLHVMYRSVHGRIRANFNWDIISKRSAVLVTAAEYKLQESGDSALGRTHLGAANVYVTNIGVHGEAGEPGGVEFYLHVDWSEPLQVMVTITVFDEVLSYERGN